MAPTLGFEAAGGMAEKFLPGISVPLLLNTITPGLLILAAVYPFAPSKWQHFLSIDVEKGWPVLIGALVIVLALGSLVSALTDEFYKVYEGRIFWPQALYDRGVARQQRRVENLEHKAEAVKDENPQRYDEYWYRLRIYPINPETDKTYATHPTLLGNILYGYEEYPFNRYGMDSVFYWPRLWLVVDKDLKEDIRKSWATADGLLNISGVSNIAGLTWLGAVLGVGVGLLSPQWLPVSSSFLGSLALTAAWFLFGYSVYRLSLSFHRKNGETFKSLFDLYRDKLSKITSLAPQEAERWTAAWAYLQYLQLTCPLCGRATISVLTKKCGNPQCQADGSEVVDEFRRSGKLVKLAKDSGISVECRELIVKLGKALADES